MAATRVAYVFPNSRRDLIAQCRAGEAPDTHLLGLNHLATFGVEAEAREPALDRRGGFLPTRVRWHLREVTLPWELRDVDVVFTPLANVIPLAARVRGGPSVLVYNFGLNTILRRAGRVRRRLLVASLRRTARVVCLGPSQRDELLELTDLDPGHADVALHGVDEHFFAPAEEPRERLVIAIGRDLARDYETLVRATRTIDARVVFVVLRRNLEGIDVPANVDVRERIPYSELRDLYRRAGVAVVALRPADYPYGSEGSGVSAVLEAQASATPLVATDRPIIRDYVRDGESGLIVPPEDPPALRSAIVRALDDRDLADALGRAGRRRVEEQHTMDDMAARLAPLVRAAADPAKTVT
jgi:glycosyltransferase involved in cell wall biosynthesis